MAPPNQEPQRDLRETLYHFERALDTPWMTNIVREIVESNLLFAILQPCCIDS